MIAYYAGGYVAGRMSRFDGARQGFGVWLFGLVVTLVVAAAGAILGDQYNVFDKLNLPRIPSNASDLTTGGGDHPRRDRARLAARGRDRRQGRPALPPPGRPRRAGRRQPGLAALERRLAVGPRPTARHRPASSSSAREKPPVITAMAGTPAPEAALMSHDREHDAVLAKRAVPGDRVVVVGVDERAVDACIEPARNFS